ncbi:MAG: 2,4'-dihydroxyacetophenone dioxygenase family protein [Sphingopyxis sp.]
MALPTSINHQNYLLTVNIDKEEIIENVLPGVHSHPLFLDPENGTWVLYAKFEPGTVLPKHFHTGTVHFYTTAGTWHYLEYPDDKQVAGSYLYEPGGSIHTFSVPADATECAEGFMVVTGANINFDADGEFYNVMDAGWIEEIMLAACKAAGKKPPRYIKPKRGADFSDA